jgi:outer membrane receptor for ferrienterochelin and colicins
MPVRGSLLGARALLPVLALAWAGVAAAQSSGIVPQVEGRRRLYTVEQFARFAPLNAADVVSQIPGFSVSNVSTERGLGEASQNVLINGQRITGKNNDAMTMLRRIPIKSVLRLELVDGATLDIGGLAGDVVNVITDQQGIEGNYTWRPQFRERGIKDHLPAGDLNLSGKSTFGDFTAGLRWDGFRGGGHGEEVEYRPATDVTLLRRREPQFGFDAPKLSVSFSHPGAAGSIWNINASVDRARDIRHVVTRFQEEGEPPTTDDSRGRTQKWRTEVGTDYEFPLATGKLKLVGFFSQKQGPNDDVFIRTEEGSRPTGSRFLQDSAEGERVARAEFRWKDLGTDWRLSAEAGHNFVDARGALEILDANGVFQPSPFAGATSRVEELRGESILNASRPLGSALSLQVSGGVEFSQLKQDGEAGQTRNFWRPKGSVSLAWNPASRWEMNLKLQRKVGQLNFYDFLASVDLDNNTSNGSNGALVPPQSWLLQLETIRNLGAVGKVSLNLTGERIEDRVEQIPISATTEAPGNVPQARKLEASLDASLLLDGIGIRGGRLDLFGSVRDTQLRDPLDGSHRRLNGNRYYWNIDFRHDIPGTPLAWGLFGEKQGANHTYRLDYENTSWSTRPYGMVFVEHKNVWGTKVRMEVANLLTSRDRSLAVSYVDRRDGPVEYKRASTTDYGWIYRLRVSGTF